MKRFLVGVAIFVAAGPLWSGVAHAQKPSAAELDQAKKFFQAGEQAYEAGQYLVAATAFEEAYRVTPFAAITFSMAQAYRRQYFVDRDAGKLKRAVNLYRAYLGEAKKGGRRQDASKYLADLEPLLARIESDQRREGKGPVGEARMNVSSTQLMVSSKAKGALASVDGSPPAEVPLLHAVTPGKHEVRVEADGYFAESVEVLAVEGRLVAEDVDLRPMPAKLTVRTMNGAEVAVDGRPAGEAPFAEPLKVPSGKHLVTVTRNGHYPLLRELTFVRGNELVLNAPLAATQQRRVARYFLYSAGAVTVGGFAATGLMLWHQKNAQDLLDKSATTNLSEEERARYSDQRAQRDSMFKWSLGLYGGAVALGVSGILLYAFDSPHVEAPVGQGLSPLFGPDGVGLSYAGRF